jgi:tRNA A22 N-methylase
LIARSKNKLAKKIYASDNKRGPIEQAQKNLDEYEINDVFLLIGDGLEPYKDIKIDTYVIAGMGGHKISLMLDDVKKEKLIMEPRSDFDLLRKKLKEIGYKIIDERFEINHDKEFMFIVAIKDKTNIINDVDIYVGPILKKTKEKQTLEYYDNLIDKYDKLKKASNSDKFDRRLEAYKK